MGLMLRLMLRQGCFSEALRGERCSVCAVANSLLASNPSLAQTMQSLGPASGPLATQCSALQSVLSNASASTPLHPSASLQADGLQSVLSGNLPGAGSGVLLAAETVAPCMKGANKNKAQVKEVRASSPARYGVV